jgi:hypothetical protein
MDSMVRRVDRIERKLDDIAVAVVGLINEARSNIGQGGRWQDLQSFRPTEMADSPIPLKKAPRSRRDST